MKKRKRMNTHEVRPTISLGALQDLPPRVVDEFIADAGVEGEEDYDAVRRAADHARYDRRVREMDDRDLEQVAEDISQRYRRTAVRYTGEMSDVPQRLLMPSVHDANLWQVRVRVCGFTTSSVQVPMIRHPAGQREGHCVQSHAESD